VVSPSFEELEGRCLLSGGWFDGRIGSAGTISTPLGLMTAQKEIDSADGKHFFVGSIFEAGKWDFAVVRTDANDQLDTTFGSGGIVATVVSSNGTDTAYDVLFQRDGKIVVVGRAGFTLGANGWLTSPGGFGLVRYNTDGSLDRTFGTNGETITPIGGEAVAAAQQRDGKPSPGLRLPVARVRESPAPRRGVQRRSPGSDSDGSGPHGNGPL